MKWKTPSGNIKNFNPAKYRIDFNKRAPSSFAQIVKDFIRHNCFYDYWCEEMRLPGTLLRCDFINWTKRIAIEVHGEQHEKFNPFFHRSVAGYRDSLIRDGTKIKNLVDNGFNVIELYKEDLDFLEKKYLIKKFNIYL